jgi:ribosomal protein S18 acetylase RimI-like enzyme
MNYEIKTANEENIPEVINLLREFAEFENLTHDFLITEDRLRQAIFGEKAFVYLIVALSENEVIALALLYPKFASFRGERSLYLEDLYVKREFRGKGLGLAMLREAAKSAKENGFQRLDWQALKWNTPAIDFYQKIGAEPDDENINFRLTGEKFERLAS